LNDWKREKPEGSYIINTMCTKCGKEDKEFKGRQKLISSLKNYGSVVYKQEKKPLCNECRNIINMEIEEDNTRKKIEFDNKVIDIKKKLPPILCAFEQLTNKEEFKNLLSTIGSLLIEKSTVSRIERILEKLEHTLPKLMEIEVGCNRCKCGGSWKEIYNKKNKKKYKTYSEECNLCGESMYTKIISIK